MMRYVFYSLLAANIAYYFYMNHWREDETIAIEGAVGQLQDVARIELLAGTDRQFAREARINDAIINPVRERDTGETCNSIGPFPDVFAGQAVVDQLASLGLATEVRALDRETGESDYRVMIPPVNSLEEAFRKLRELRSRNVESYVITEGPDALAISLGVFSTRDAARNAHALRSREGYRAVVVEIPRLAREFWIFGRGDDAALDLESALWATLKERRQDLVQRPSPCPAPVAAS